MMKFRTFLYFLKEAFRSFFRNGWMTIASILTVTLSLFILGMFMTTVWNLNHAASYLENQVELSVYLKDGLTSEQIHAVEQKIKSAPQTKSVAFVNKDQALAEFKDRLGDQSYLLDSLNGNPLPSSFTVVYETPSGVHHGAELFVGYPEVESVQYGQETIEKLFQFTQIVRIGGMILIIFLAFATIFIVSNTIRLTVYARRKEIEIMKYVGATNGFIRWPFLLEGMILGTIGAIFAGICLWQLYVWALRELVANGFAFLPLIPVYPFIAQVAAILLVAGILIGVVGSAISVHKYMKV